MFIVFVDGAAGQSTPGFGGSTRGFDGSTPMGLVDQHQCLVDQHEWFGGPGSTPRVWWINTSVWWNNTNGLVVQDQHPGFGGSTAGFGGSTPGFGGSTPRVLWINTNGLVDRHPGLG